jgi:hypothetical protein
MRPFLAGGTRTAAPRRQWKVVDENVLPLEGRGAGVAIDKTDFNLNLYRRLAAPQAAGGFGPPSRKTSCSLGPDGMTKNLGFRRPPWGGRQANL